jgi:hypothetical protein
MMGSRLMKSGDEVDRDMNHIPVRLWRPYVEVNLTSNSYNFEESDEKDTSTLHVSKKLHSCFPSRRKKPKTVALEPEKWSHRETAFRGRSRRGGRYALLTKEPHKLTTVECFELIFSKSIIDFIQCQTCMLSRETIY